MPGEIRELAEQVAKHLNRHDLERLVALSDPEVECYSFFAGLGEEGVYLGHAGIRKWATDLNEAWEEVDAEVEDAIVSGDVAVLVGRIHYRGKGSGAGTSSRVGWMLKFRQGKLVRFRAFRDPEEALEAVGLRE